MLENFFKYPYRKGYTRFFDEGKCYYIPTEEMKRLLLEDLVSMKFTKTME